MRIELDSARHKTLFAGSVLLTAALYFYWVQNHFRAESWGDSLHLAGLERAVSLEPGNSDLQNKLGRFQLVVEQDSAAAIKTLNRATELNRFVPSSWLTLAFAYNLENDRLHQLQALDQATWADPKTPVVAWEEANIFLSEDDNQKALRFLRTVIEYDPASQKRAFDTAWRATHDVDEILREAMPDRIDAHLAFIAVLAADRQTAPALKVWNSMTAMNEHFNAHDSIFFPHYLIEQHEVEQAARVWKDISRYSPSLMPDTKPDEVPVVNGGFEDEIIYGGLSWRIDPSTAVEIQVDENEFHTGSRSLALNFTGSPFQLAGIAQYVPVEPKASYELSAFIKAQEIQTASGPRFYIQDAYDHSILAMGPEFQGTSAWREDHTAFVTGPQTKLIAIRIARQSPDKLIRGRLWIDDVHLFKR